MEQEIIDTLTSIGLTEGEAKTYLALSAIGTSTVGAIIKYSGVSASKVYQILQRLMRKGLVSMIVEEGKKVFTALPPDMLLQYLDNEKKIIETNKKKVSDIIPILKLKQGSRTKLPLAEYVRGEKGFASFRQKFFELAKEKHTYNAIAGSRVAFKLQKHWFPQSEQFAEKHITQKVVYDKYTWHEKDESVHRRSERKDYYPIILKKKYTDLPNLSTLGENTVITDVDEKGEVYSFFIHNKTLTDSFVKLIQLVRDMGEVPKGYKKEPDE
ncbi:hypothetical protein HQ533_05025 [Candidatus Woesearchaeota archaeon]|nr:hypothetical protein [Candidatus Woesearchaeota archaeon]